jgi:hypothetical protein
MPQVIRFAGRGISRAKIGWASAGVVVATAVVVVLVGVGGGAQGRVQGSALAPPLGVTAQVTSVPASVLNQVGIAGNRAAPNTTMNPVNVVARSGGALPRVDGKPVFFFYGAEWCPYCATERWSIIVALSRFGTFKGLGLASSSPTDIDPNTETFAFHGSTYTSPYVAFSPVEVESMSMSPLDKPNAAETGVLRVWDPALEFPFLNVAGRYVGGLPTWDDPKILDGLTRNQIAELVWDPASAVGNIIDANANYLVAAICAVDGGRPGQVCHSAGTGAAATQLKALPNAVPLG